MAMKTPLFLLLICTLQLYITFSSCQDDVQQIKIKSQARKMKKMQILNPRKFFKPRSDDGPYKWKKRVDRKDEYTVFPAIKSGNNPGGPDSPFFPQERGIEPKRRVKKVLPDYFFDINRKKRSVKNEGQKKPTSKVTMKRSRKNVSNLKSKSNVAVNVKRKLRSKVVTTPNPRLKYTQKNRKRVLRNQKRGEKSQRREQKIQKRHQKVAQNLRNKLKPQKKKDSRRLIAGKDAMIAEYPYVVSIQKGGEHWCAGALLNPRLVITTANCVWKSNRITRLRVRAGSRHTDRGGQRARVQEVVKHPKWNIRGKPDYDVALLLLDRNIKFSDSVHGVDLPNHVMMPVFEDAWVTSWGSERRDGIYPDNHYTLQVYHQRLMDHEKCNNVTKRFGVIVTENFICLAQTGRRAPCTRDTGAPAVSDGVLWGLASWGIRKLCGTERFPAMFSYLASHSNMNFITNATHYLMSEERHYPFPDRFPVVRPDAIKH